MDTYFNVEWDVCNKCYECIRLCKKTYPKILGHLFINPYGGEPDYDGDNCRCHHCDAIVDGKETSYACSKICPSGAIKIERW